MKRIMLLLLFISIWILTWNTPKEKYEYSYKKTESFFHTPSPSEKSISLIEEHDISSFLDNTKISFLNSFLKHKASSILFPIIQSIGPKIDLCLIPSINTKVIIYPYHSFL